MGYYTKVSTTDMEKALLLHGSIKSAAKALGISFDTVRRRLPEAPLQRPPLSDQDKDRIRSYYETTPEDEFDLVALARELGRTRQFISRHAGLMGLTRRGRPHRPEARKSSGRKISEAIAERGHPRGMAGKHHTEETKKRLAETSAAMWEEMKETGTGLMSPEALQATSDRMSKMRQENIQSNPYSRTKGGKRPDLGDIHFRSSWEANYARYLNRRLERGEIESWEHEPETFWFDKIRRGVRSYKPDFRIIEKGQVYYVEIKGWFDAKSKTKIKRMAKYHPKIDLRLVDSKMYAALEREVGREIPNWEFKERKRLPKKAAALDS